MGQWVSQIRLPKRAPPDLSVLSGELVPKCQEEIIKRELIVILAPIHVKHSGWLFGEITPICEHLVGDNCSYPLRRNWSSLIQAALFELESPSTACSRPSPLGRGQTFWSHQLDPAGQSSLLD